MVVTDRSRMTTHSFMTFLFLVISDRIGREWKTTVKSDSPTDVPPMYEFFRILCKGTNKRKGSCGNGRKT